jgi:hypothetical protein
MLITVGYSLLEVQKFEGAHALTQALRASAWENGTMSSARAAELERITASVIQATKEAVAVWDRRRLEPGGCRKA